MAGSKLWTPLDIVTLASWLDYCVENDIQFENTILHRLEESRQSASCEPYPFTIQQVKNKMIDIGRTNSKHQGASEMPGYEKILETGSGIFFPRLGEDMREMVRKAFQVYDKTHSPQINKQRSAAQSPATLTSKKRAMNARGTTESSFPTVDTSSRGPIPNNLHRLANDQASSSRCEIAGYATELDVAGAGRGNELARMKAQWDKEVEIWSAEKAELTGKVETLLAMVKDAETSRHIREAMSMDPSESKLYLYQREINDLRRRHRAVQQEVPFFRKIPDQARSLSPKINDAIDKITHELDFMLHDTDFTRVTEMQISNAGDLASLIESGLGLQQQTTGSLLEECISKFGLTVVVRTLSLTAMRDWVFLTDYPNFAPDDISSSLLKWYRTIAYDIGDWKSLRNWDIAAYSGLLNSDQFKEILLPHEAHYLADRLAKALDPIFHSRTSEEDRMLGSKEIREDLCDHFTDMFKAGLTLKAASITTDNQYVFVVHPVGTTFQPGHPVDQGQMTSRRHTSTHDNLSLISWILASLKVFNSRDPNMLDRQGDALVQTRNFLRNEEDLGAIRCIYEKSITVWKSDSELQSENFRVAEANAILRAPNIAQVEGSTCEEERASAVVPEKRSSLRPTVCQSTQRPAFVCGDCGSPLRDIANLQRHKLNKSCCRCKACGEKFRTNSRLKDHLRSKHPGNSQTLKELGGQAESARPGFKSALALEPPTTRISEDGELKCPRCTKTFSRKDTLAIHISRRACTRCLPCDIKYRYGWQLRKHETEEHGREASPTNPSGSSNQISSPALSHNKNIHSEDNFRQDIQAADGGGALPTSSGTVSAPGGMDVPEGSTKPRATNLPQASSLASASRTIAGPGNQVHTAPSKRKLTSGKDDGGNRAKRIASIQGSFASAKNVPKGSHTEFRRQTTPETRHVARMIEQVAKYDKGHAGPEGSSG